MLRYALYLLLLGLIGLLDFRTGYEISLGGFYVLLLGLVAWNSGRATGLSFALLSVVVWGVAHQMTGHYYARPFILYWNGANRMLTFSVIVVCLSKIRRSLEKQKRLIFDLRRLSLNLSTLNDVIPVCCLCHRFRDDVKYRLLLENFVREHPDAQSVGQVCPECVEKRLQRIAQIPTDLVAPGG